MTVFDVLNPKKKEKEMLIDNFMVVVFLSFLFRFYILVTTPHFHVILYNMHVIVNVNQISDFYRKKLLNEFFT